MAKTGYVWDGTQFVSISSPIAAVPNAVTSYNSIAPAVKTTRTNLITNPSFEVDTTGWNISGPAVRSTSVAKYGSASLQLTRTTGTTVVSSSAMPVTAGQMYTASLWFYLTAANMTNVEWDLIWRNAAGSVVLDDGPDNLPTGLPVNEWVRLTYSKVAPATSVEVLLRTFCVSGSAVWYVDGLMFEQSSTLNPYFDGTNYSPITEAYPSSITTAWTGTANASTSTISYYKQSDVKIGQLWIDSSTMITYVYNGSAWVMVSGSLPIDLNINTITSNYNIPVGSNGLSAGPITIGSGTTTTINLNSTWSII